jgi:hypothetical protein
VTRLEGGGDTRRQALHPLAVVAPAWWRAGRPPAWRARETRRAADERLPTTPAARAARAPAIGGDGGPWRAAVEHPGAPPWRREGPAVATRRRVWRPHALWAGTQRRGREADHSPPAAPFLRSPDDGAAHEARQYPTQGGVTQARSRPPVRLRPRLSSRRSNPCVARRPLGRPPPRGMRRCRRGVDARARPAWPPAAWPPTGASGVRRATAWSCGGPRAATITGKPGQGPAVTPRTARWMGPGTTPSVPRASPVSAGRPPWVTAAVPSARCSVPPRPGGPVPSEREGCALASATRGGRSPSGPRHTSTPDTPPGSATRRRRGRRRMHAARAVTGRCHAAGGVHACDGRAIVAWPGSASDIL